MLLPNQLNLDAIQAFAAFAETLNFTSAAQLLHISQPALHTKIGKLEDHLGTPLYVRSGRALQLTPLGESVARFGRDLCARTEQFCAATEGRTHQTITLTAGDGAYMYLLGSGVQAFLRTRDSRLLLLTSDRDRSIQLVREGRAILGVAPIESVPADLDASVLSVVGQMLVVPRKHSLAKCDSLNLKDLAGSRLIVPPENRPHRRMLSQMLQSEDVPWSIAVEASGWELMMRFTQMGIGIAVVNACCKVPRDLKAIPIPELPKLHYHVFRLRDAIMPPEADRLAHLLRQHANDWKKD